MKMSHYLYKLSKISNDLESLSSQEVFERHVQNKIKYTLINRLIRYFVRGWK